MTYIELINRFWQAYERAHFGQKEIALYFYLLDTANRLMWPVTFGCSSKGIATELGLSEGALTRARKRLQEFGLLTYSSGTDKRHPSLYGFPGHERAAAIARPEGRDEQNDALNGHHDDQSDDRSDGSHNGSRNGHHGDHSDRGQNSSGGAGSDGVRNGHHDGSRNGSHDDLQNGSRDGSHEGSPILINKNIRLKDRINKISPPIIPPLQAGDNEQNSHDSDGADEPRRSPSASPPSARPTLGDVKDFFKARNEESPLPGWETEAERFFLAYDSTGWIDGSGRVIVRWQSRALLWIMDNCLGREPAPPGTQKRNTKSKRKKPDKPNGTKQSNNRDRHGTDADSKEEKDWYASF